MISTGELRKGVTIELDGKLYSILEYEHIKMGRGSAQVRIRLRDVRAGHITERTFQAGERFARARLERRTVQYLYEDDGLYYFMDKETFEQTPLTKEQLGDALNYLKGEFTLDLLTYQTEAIGVEIPLNVELQITETGPSFKGDTAQGGTKPATLETGLMVHVPLFLNTGDRVKVDTRTGQYIERA
ncbi:MAG: elongation factor P [Dehalococcoidia bacterium]|nr:elongation factor P [Dehalococcoidia bacterium]